MKLLWVLFLTGAVIAISPGVLAPTAPFNGLSVLGTAIMAGSFLAMSVIGGEEEDDL